METRSKDLERSLEMPPQTKPEKKQTTAKTFRMHHQMMLNEKHIVRIIM